MSANYGSTAVARPPETKKILALQHFVGVQYQYEHSAQLCVARRSLMHITIDCHTFFHCKGTMKMRGKQEWHCGGNTWLPTSALIIMPFHIFPGRHFMAPSRCQIRPVNKSNTIEAELCGHLILKVMLAYCELLSCARGTAVRVHNWPFAKMLLCMCKQWHF